MADISSFHIFFAPARVLEAIYWHFRAGRARFIRGRPPKPLAIAHLPLRDKKPPPAAMPRPLAAVE